MAKKKKLKSKDIAESRWAVWAINGFLKYKSKKKK